MSETVNTIQNDTAVVAVAPLLPPEAPPDAKHEVSMTLDLNGLVEFVSAKATVFMDDDGASYARIAVDDHLEVATLASGEFGRWLDGHVFRTTGRLAPPGVRKEALAVLEARARYGSPPRRVNLRVGAVDGGIAVDLTDSTWRSVMIDAGGWRVIAQSPEVFRRSSVARPLPAPVSGGSIDELREFVNCHDDDFPLLVGWLLAAYRPTGPYPLALLTGEQGSAKSTTAKVLRALVDPCRTPVTSFPTSERELAVSAQNNWAPAFDNLSSLRVAMSDALCRMSTGGAFTSRAMFTNSQECVLEFMRPVILNGIEEIAVRPDLAERCLTVNCLRISDDRRKDEASFWRAFGAAAPRILGALFAGVSAALRNIDAVRLSELPRMADFARWVTAAESGLDWSQGTIVSAHSRARANANADAVEGDTLCSLLLGLPALRDGGAITCTATQLLAVLHERARETRRSHDLPRAANALSGRLTRVKSLLRAAGYEVDVQRSNNARTITIWRLSGSSPALTPRLVGPRRDGEPHDALQTDEVAAAAE